MRAIIRSELKDCSVIAVAHRICEFQRVAPRREASFSIPLATIIDFDYILVMDDGHVVGSGPPRELLADPSARFTCLAMSQEVVLGEDADRT